MAAPTAPVPGANGKLYRNTGSYGSPTLDLIGNCRSVTPHVSFSDVDVSNRNTGGFKAHEPGLGDFDFSIEGMYDPSDSDMTTLQTAALAKTGYEYFILDGLAATTGSSGMRAWCKIFDFKRGEDLDGIMNFTFELKVAYSTNAPSYYTAA